MIPLVFLLAFELHTPLNIWLLSKQSLRTFFQFGTVFSIADYATFTYCFILFPYTQLQQNFECVAKVSGKKLIKSARKFRKLIRDQGIVFQCPRQ